MNRKLIGTLALFGCLTVLSGCYAGPKRLSRTWNDYENKAYVENAWMTAVLSNVVPVYPIVGWFAGFGDLFVNSYYFWVKDAFGGNTGTAYIHENPQGAAKSLTGAGF
ncbi:MAG: hypothetical protein ACKVWV_19060 [Planctomycetota bacterium]